MAADTRTLVYYGPDREKHLPTLDQYDIVITTYNVVAFEWKEYNRFNREVKSHRLLSFTWHRIVLDEGMSLPKDFSLCFIVGQV